MMQSREREKEQITVPMKENYKTHFPLHSCPLSRPKTKSQSQKNLMISDHKVEMTSLAADFAENHRKIREK